MDTLLNIYIIGTIWSTMFILWAILTYIGEVRKSDIIPIIFGILSSWGLLIIWAVDYLSQKYISKDVIWSKD